jgi:SAM-dependent methyltransferase
MAEPRGQQLINRYKNNYDIPASCEITEKAILEHWELEKSLREELLQTTTDNRWEVFESCYTKLYSELAWLNELTNDKTKESSDVSFGHWVDLIGSPPKKIYEIGSGKGELISYLAGCGFECKATEITRERGSKWASTHPNLTWGISDGIHLDRFEPADFYDVAISNQVVEHMHPDDLLDHFRGVYTILKNGGVYIFSTPHASIGPSDISRVFQQNKPMGMHLKEYTYFETTNLLELAGFKKIYAPLRLPKKIRKLFAIHLNAKPSTAYLTYLCALEKLISTLPTQTTRRKATKVSKAILFASNLMVVAEKTEEHKSGTAAINLTDRQKLDSSN